MKLHLTSLCFALALIGVPSVVHAQNGTSWDDLTLAKSSRSQRIYLLPGADFSPYTKVILDTTEVAFRKNWLRDYNRSSRELSRRISQDDANEVVKKVSTNFGDVFAREYQKAGFQVVTAPGPDVLRVRTAVIDLAVNAPDVKSAGRVHTFSEEAGEATLVLEARDSQTGALLGRALDRRYAGETRPYLRNAVTNRGDFRALFGIWAKESVEGLKALRAGAPVNVAKAGN